MASTNNLGKLSHLVCDTLGEPGSRRFRLHLLGESGESALVWIEKQQLIALVEAIEAVLTAQEYRHIRGLPEDPIPPPIPLSPTFELDARAGEFSLGLDEEQGHIVVVAAGATDTEEQRVSGEFTFEQGYVFNREAAELVAAGRPPCPLCHAPLDPEGHVCPKRNGHHRED